MRTMITDSMMSFAPSLFVFFFGGGGFVVSGIPKYDYGRLGRPEPCVGVCFYQKQLAAAEAAKKQRRGPSRRKRIFL